MKIGARSVKTGLAVILSMYVAYALHLTPITMGAIAAAFAIQPSIYRSFQTVIDNVQGNLIGAAIAIIFVLFIGSNPVIIGLAVIIVIIIHLKLKLHSTITLTMVTVIIIMGGTPPNEPFIIFALNRVLLVFIGVASAFVVNLVFLPPNYENKLYYKILNQTTDLFKWIRLIGQHASDHTMIKNELKTFQDEKFKMSQFYLWFKEERHYLKRHRFRQHRKMVVYRQMIATTNRLHELLKTLHRNEKDFHQLPANMALILQQRLEKLMAIHERILLKFNGKIRADHNEEYGKDSFQHKTKITESFFDGYQNNSDENGVNWLNLFPLIAHIVDYSQNLEHLDRLVDSFKSFHTKDNHVNLIEEKID